MGKLSHVQNQHGLGLAKPPPNVLANLRLPFSFAGCQATLTEQLVELLTGVEPSGLQTANRSAAMTLLIRLP
jgi:hypothetical protein